MDIKRNAAALSAAAIVGALGIGGVMSAHADSAPTQSPVTQTGADGETNDDATDVGPDANPNEPGHQDASDVAGDDETEGVEGSEGADDAEEADDPAEAADGETDDDATDVGPDANPNEPGHQDAGE